MKTKHSYTYTGKNRGHLKKASCLRLCLSTLYLLHTYSHTHLCTDYFIVHLSYIHSIPNKKKYILLIHQTSLYIEYTLIRILMAFVHFTSYYIITCMHMCCSTLISRYWYDLWLVFWKDQSICEQLIL